jgi:hypothetical protein
MSLVFSRVEVTHIFRIRGARCRKRAHNQVPTSFSHTTLSSLLYIISHSTSAHTRALTAASSRRGRCRSRSSARTDTRGSRRARRAIFQRTTSTVSTRCVWRPRSDTLSLSCRTYARTAARSLGCCSRRTRSNKSDTFAHSTRCR